MTSPTSKDEHARQSEMQLLSSCSHTVCVTVKPSSACALLRHLLGPILYIANVLPVSPKRGVVCSRHADAIDVPRCKVQSRLDERWIDRSQCGLAPRPLVMTPRSDNVIRCHIDIVSPYDVRQDRPVRTHERTSGMAHPPSVVSVAETKLTVMIMMMNEMAWKEARDYYCRWTGAERTLRVLT